MDKHALAYERSGHLLSSSRAKHELFLSFAVRCGAGEQSIGPGQSFPVLSSWANGTSLSPLQVNTKGDKYIVNGKYDEKELAELLDKFIKKYVLCPDCGNPETNMVSFGCLAAVLCPFPRVHSPDLPFLPPRCGRWRLMSAVRKQRSFGV